MGVLDAPWVDNTPEGRRQRREREAAAMRRWRAAQERRRAHSKAQMHASKTARVVRTLWWERATQPVLLVKDTYTRDEVAYLIGLAFRHGQWTRYNAELADLHRTWDREGWRRTAAQGMAERRAQMDADYRAAHRKFGRPDDYEYKGGPVPWDDTDVGKS